MNTCSTKKAPSARSKSLKVQYVGGGKQLSSQAGLIQVVRFLDQLGFDATWIMSEGRVPPINWWTWYF